MSYALANPSVNEAASLARFGADAFRETWQHLYTREVMQRYLDSAFSEEAVAAALRDPACRYWVIRHAADIAGYAKAGPVMLPVDDAGEHLIELQRIYVSPLHQRKGLARRLLNAFEEHVQENKFRRAFVCVWSNNAPALALYRAFGFREVGTHYFPLGDFTNYEIDPDFILRKDYTP